MNSPSLELPSPQELLVFDFSGFLDPTIDTEHLREDVITRAEQIAGIAVQSFSRLQPGEAKIIAEMTSLAPRKLLGATENKMFDRAALLSNKFLGETKHRVKIHADKAGIAFQFGSKYFFEAEGNEPRFIIEEFPKGKIRVDYRCKLIMPDPSFTYLRQFRRLFAGLFS